MRLNIGCGRHAMEGWTNLDIMPLPGVDVVWDLEQFPLPFDTDTVDEVRGSHVLEHIHDILGLMQELHRIAKPEARAMFRVPYGSSDDAWEDPTHTRAFFVNSWGYYGQPFYHSADYDYRGDWKVDRIVLAVAARFDGQPVPVIMDAVRHQRNVVLEMAAQLSAVKPIREPVWVNDGPKMEIQIVPDQSPQGSGGDTGDGQGQDRAR